MFYCYDCGKKMKKKEGYCWEDDNLGKFELKNEIFHQCENCKEEMISFELLKKIEIVEQGRISELLYHRAISLNDLSELFFSNKELVNALEMSRQAIAKNGRVKTLIYHFTFKDQTYYYKESVVAFKEKGDGRIDLTGDEYKSDHTIIAVEVEKTVNTIDTIDTIDTINTIDTIDTDTREGIYSIACYNNKTEETGESNETKKNTTYEDNTVQYPSMFRGFVSDRNKK